MSDSRGLEALSLEDCQQRLRQQTLGRLGVNVGSQPDIFPVNYVMDGDDVVIRTEPGTKLAAAVMGQNVAFEIDSIDTETRTGWSVVVHGTASESRRLTDVMRDQELPVQPWVDDPKTRLLRITPIEITGRAISNPEPE